MEFNPNNPATTESNVFGLPYTALEASLVLLPVEWEATVSYGTGTSRGPAAILEASKQIDLYHPLVDSIWTRKVVMADFSEALAKKSKETQVKVTKVLAQIEAGKRVNQKLLQEVNDSCAAMIQEVEKKAEKYLKAGKAVATVGGDHSTPLGLFRALGKRQEYGILQIDAHCDLRKAYEGFQYSHASIMYNALEEIKQIESLTQVGIRDYCEEEVSYIATANGRVHTFYDRNMQQSKMKGTTWHQICEAIISTLPHDVFISFDIDGLTPDHCPNTGTPVPGGLTFSEAMYLIEQVALQRNIIGFDLNEVSPGADDWDANVGARVLFQLCAAYWISRERL